MFNRQKRLSFSIRKFSVGVASTLIGVGWLLTSAQVVEASQIQQSQEIRYRYVLESELSQTDRARLVTDLSSKQVNDLDTYYMVYRPLANSNQAMVTSDQPLSQGLNQGKLPRTNSSVGELASLAGLGILLIGVAVSKRGKKKLVLSLLILTASGQMLSVSAIEGHQLAAYNQTHQLAVGDSLPETAIKISGYEFIGYIAEDQLPNASGQAGNQESLPKVEAGVKEVVQPSQTAPGQEAESPVSGQANSVDGKGQKSPSPSTNQETSPQETITYEKAIETVRYTETKISDPNLEVGKTQIVTPGQDGQIEKTIKVTKKPDGSVTREVTSSREVKAPVNQLVAVGTKLAPTAPNQPVQRTVDEVVAFEIEYVEDPSRPLGEEVITQFGQNGLKRITYTDGQVTGEELVTAPVKQVISRGSQVTTPPVVTETVEVIPYRTDIIEDDSLDAGTEVLVQAGQNGQRTVKTVDGQIVSSTVTQEAVPALIRRGTKPAVIINKADLMAQVELAIAKPEATYTVETYAVVEAAYQEALLILNKPDATQAEIDAQTAVLSVALANLVEKPVDTISKVEEELAFERQTISDNSLPEGQEKVVQEGQKGLVEVTYTNGVETDRKVIRPAQAEIVHIGSKKALNRQPLEEAVAKAQALTASDYSQASWADLLLELAQAQTVLAQADLTQADLEQARDRLETAIRDLTVDKLPLETLVAEGAKLEELDYSPESWQDFFTYQQQAQTVLDNPLATQKQVNQAQQQLEEAKLALTTDRRRLEAQLAIAQGLDTSPYTRASLANLNQVLQAVQQVVDKQAAINQAADQVEEALKQLVALKTKPSLSWQALAENDLHKSAQASYRFADPENAHESTVIKVYDGEALLKAVPVTNWSQTEITGLAYDRPYRLVTEMVYDLGDGPVTERIEDKEVLLELKKIEIKDIDKVTLHKQDGDQTLTYRSLDLAPQDVSDYFVRIESDKFRDILLPVAKIEDGNLNGEPAFKVTVALDQLVQDKDASHAVTYQDQYSFYLPKVSASSGDIYRTFKDLIEAMTLNPGGNFTLGADLFAGDILPDKGTLAYLAETFTGTLNGSHDGKAYAIHDLKLPLFALASGTISNLDLRGVDITTSSDRVGALAKETAKGAQVTNVAATGKVQGNRHVGGLIGKAVGTVFDNVAFEGTIKADNKANNGENFVGGIAGRMEDAQLAKAFVNADISAYAYSQNHRVGGLVGSLYARRATTLKEIHLKGSVTNLADSVDGASAMVGSLWQYGRLEKAVTEMKVNQGAYIYGDTRHTNPGIQKSSVFAVQDVAQATLKDAQASFISAAEAQKMVESFNITATTKDTERAIYDQTVTTDYSQLEGAQADRDQVYRNMEKLLPFYDKGTLVKYGNKVDPATSLYQKKILSVTPMIDDQVVSDVHSHKTDLNRLMVYYADKTVDYLRLTYKEDFHKTGISEYKIEGTELIYTPEQFLSSYDQVLATVLPDLQSMVYRSQEMADAIGITHTEAEITEAMKKLPEREEAIVLLAEEKMDRLYLEEEFNKILANPEPYLRALLATDKSANVAGGAVDNYLIDYIKDNKEKLFLGLAYVQRWYNIDFGQTDIQDLASYHQDFYGKPIETMEWLVGLVDAGYNNLRLANNLTTYQSHMANQTGYANLFDYLSANRQLFTNYATDNDWFKASSKAYEVETPSEETPTKDVTIWNRLTTVESEKNGVLPLLTAQEGIYVISNMSGVSYGMYDRYMDMSLKDKNPTAYETKIRDVEAMVDRAAEWQRAHFDAWYRILPAHLKEKLVRDVPTWDGYMVRGKWLPMFGTGANQAIMDFFGPIDRGRVANNGSGAYANGTAVFYVHDTLLSEYGSSVFTHEMVHNNDGITYLGGFGRREGQGGELYAKGMLQSPDQGYRTAYLTLNLMFDYSAQENAKDRYVNLSPERFQDTDDLQEFMSGVFDVLYTLDYAEAKSVLAQNNDVKKRWFNKIENYYIQDNKGVDTHAGNTMRGLTDDEVTRLTDWQSLITENIMVIREYGNSQQLKRNSYYATNLFSPIYAALPNEKGAPGDLMFRRIAYELLAAKGYENGFVPYASNKLADEAFAAGEKIYSGWHRRDMGLVTDKRVFNTVFGTEYTDWNDFKISMFQDRIDKVGQLKPVTITYNGKEVTITSFSQIETMMDEAVRQDIAANTITNAGRSKTRQLKAAIYNAYLRQTQDFRESIYQTP